MRFKKVIVITALLLFVFPCSVFFAAINVFNGTAITINSNYPLTTGPNMPFPQFKNYKAGGQTTLYSLSDFAHQPDGVSHAEMEKWISEGWQIFANRFAYTGAPNYRLANGAAPVNFQLVNAQANNDNCSEGQGYALLCAALMADKKTFDGIWFWLVENDRLMNARKYSDGTWVSRGTNGANFGQHFISVYSPPGDSATDGDVDIAMALLIAWYQWGDFTGYYATGGHGPETNTGGLKAIKYKDMALAAIRYLVALDLGDDHTNQPRDWITGVVGFDGYHKGGNTQNENTNFVTSPNGLIDSWDGPYGFTEGPAATNENFYDYTGPSYWRAFADALIRNNDAQDLADATKLRWNGTPFGRFNVDQLERAAASDFWLQGRLNAKHAYPIAGYYNASATDATFANMNDGEDFRSIWRHALDYTLYGNPPAGKTWNPATHAIDGSTGNNYEFLSSVKVSNFLEDAAGTRCMQWGTFGLTFKGAAETRQGYNLDGSVMNGAANDWHTNYTMGSASAAILNAQRFPFMETMLRELFVTWDSQVKGDLYLSGVPVYFHEWFRMLGLLVLTGNYTDPVENNIYLASPEYKKANMKIYNAVNKTYAFTGDTLTYWLNYRNYSSTDATGVVISETIPAAFDFVSATGPYAQAGNTITWNIGAVPGLHSYANLNATMGGVTLVVRVRDDAPNAKYCTTANITCTNGTGWTSNDQPNEVTKICKTNCVDIVAAALTITKTASNHMANPGDTITYTINYCDSSSAGWINGGRYGVTFSIAQNSLSVAGRKVLTIRGAHEATEPWIDWANYRLSYFVNSSYHGVYNAATNPTGWVVGSSTEGTPGLNMSTEELVASCAPSTDPTNCWNQRLIVAFQTSITLPTHILHKYFNNDTSMHYPNGIGTLQPLSAIVSLAANGEPAQDWTDDWSKLPTTAPYSIVDYGNGGPAYFPFPITPDWTKGDGTSIPVTSINLASCNGTRPTIPNILVEEFDGYTWRRVFGDGPQPGRQVNNVFVIDSLPTGVTFGGFIDSDSATKTVAGRNITVNVGNMLVNQCSELKYWVTVNGSCPSGIVNPDMINTAFIYGDNESPVADSAIVSVTCAYVPPPPPAPSSITKTASTASPALNSTFTYTVDYTNLNGSVVNSAIASQNVFTAANWTKRYGATGIWNFNGSQASATADSSIYTYNYSHGINGTVQLRASLQDGQDFAVVVRHTGGAAIADGIYIRFNSQWDGNRIQIYNGATPIGAAKIATSMKNLDIKIVLNGGTISVFQKNITDANFPPAADLSVSGIPIRAGYAGIANGAVPGFAQWTGGAHAVTSWRTELDTAFNVLIRDPLPPALNFLGGTNSVTITAGGDIRWPVIPQMLKGASISYQWYALASGPCGPVVNVVYAEPMGVTYTVADQESISIPCGVTTPTFTPTRTRTNTNTPTNTVTITLTSSLTPTQSWTQTATLSFTFTGTASFTPTFTSTVSVTVTNTHTNTFTNTYTPTSTRTVSPSLTVTDTISSNTPTHTQTSTNTFTATQTWTSSASPTSTVPTATFTHTNSMTASPTFSATNTYTDTYTPTGTYTATPTLTHSLTVTDTMSSNTPTNTPTWSNTFTPTQSWTQTNTMTFTPTHTDTVTQTGTPVIFTPTVTPTFTDTGTFTQTPTPSSTPTESFTYTATRTYTQTLTVTDTRTQTATPSATPTVTDTATITPTPRPSPVTLDISLTVTGEDPAAGALVTYVILIENNTASPVNNVAVWDTLHQDMMFVSNDFEITPAQTGNYLYWDISHDSGGNIFTLNPGAHIRIEFTARINAVVPSRQPFTNTAMADYTDPFYQLPAKHPAIASDMEFYPIGKPVVFPNPFNIDTDTVVTFDNIVPGSLIQIYTVSGEAVKAIYEGIKTATWDSKNRNGKVVSPGIYYFVIKNQSNNEVKKGKIFVVRGN